MPKVKSVETTSAPIATYIPQETQVVPYGKLTELIPIQPYVDVSQALQAKLGCSGVYFKETGFASSNCRLKKGNKAYFNNYFGSLTFAVKGVVQRFLGRAPSARPFVLSPIGQLGGGDLPPYGRMDMLPGDNDKRNALIPKGAEAQSKCKYQVVLRPTAWSPFSIGELYDASMIEFCAWLLDHIEPAVRTHMEHAHFEGPFESNWDRTKEADTLALYGQGTQFRAMTITEIPRSDTFKAHTEELTRLCRKMFVVPIEHDWYRLTTEQERQAHPHKMVEKLTMAQITCINKSSDLVMIGYNLKPQQTKENICKLRLDVQSLIWVGHSDSFMGMAEATAEELLKHVPDFPTAPTDDELWSLPSKPKEKDVREALIEAIENGSMAKKQRLA